MSDVKNDLTTEEKAELQDEKKVQDQRDYMNKIAVPLDPEELDTGSKGHTIIINSPVRSTSGVPTEFKQVAEIKFIEPSRAAFDKFSLQATAKMLAWDKIQTIAKSIENGTFKDYSKTGEALEGMFTSAYNLHKSLADIFYDILKKSEGLVDKTPITRELFDAVFSTMTIAGHEVLFSAVNAFLERMVINEVELKNL